MKKFYTHTHTHTHTHCRTAKDHIENKFHVRLVTELKRQMFYFFLSAPDFSFKQQLKLTDTILTLALRDFHRRFVLWQS